MINAANPYFENAVDAVVSGNLPALQAMLRETPELTHARSSRPHHATLLHYLGANGVEDFRQKTPSNAVAVAQLLLDAGSEVDSVADLYGGSTTLCLVATSFHPQQAGVQPALIDLLLARGADPNHGGSLVNACLANNRLPAAEFLAAKGLSLDLPAAAGLGRLGLVQEILNRNPALRTEPSLDNKTSAAAQGFLWACAYGQDAVAALFLDRDMPIEVQDKFGQTGLHWAAIGCRLSTLQMLLARNAPLEVRNSYGGTVLGQALWSAAHARHPNEYLPAIELLIQARAVIPEGLPSVSSEIDALLSRFGRPPDPALSW